MAQQRMSKDKRRIQLLEVAANVVRSKGTDVLTLAYVAEQAGVTKPVAYEHFGTRSGLLMELFRYIETPRRELLRAAIETGATSLDSLIKSLSTAYVDCALITGPEFGAIVSALASTHELEAFCADITQSYIEQLRRALARFIPLPRRQFMPLLTGLFGSIEAVGRAVSIGMIPPEKAVIALETIIAGTVYQHSRAKLRNNAPTANSHQYF